SVTNDMIEHLKGTLIKKEPTHIIIDVNGVGYGVDVPLRASENLSQEGEPVEISTFLYVKEGIMELYGFSSDSEKEVFLKLITVSGIGPKIALRILSETSPERLVAQITDGNVLQLTSLKGIGKKTAEVMIASLRTPLAKIRISGAARTDAETKPDKALNDAVRALMALGVKEGPSQSAVEKAMEKLGGKTGTSRIITEALKLI
ncbi:Holliday junction branch migration protein RuvA, partial [Fibrobacterota bacterium]